MTNTDEILFINEEENVDIKKDKWKILIVDDDEDVHAITNLALYDFTYDHKKLDFESAYSAKEAIEKLSIPDNLYSFVLLDIVMESDDAGLNVAHFIRRVLKNTQTRIVIRTGQAGNLIEEDIIEDYDINDFKEKTELTKKKLYTVIRSSLSQYKQILELEQQKDLIYNDLMTDNLTGLYSRKKLYEELAKGNNSLILVDIAKFSDLNHTYGNSIGNAILISFSKFLLTTCGECDFFRIESDKFVLLYKDKTDNFLIEFSESLALLTSNYTKYIDEFKLKLLINIGIANYPNTNLLQCAEVSLNLNKRNFTSDYIVYSKDLESVKSIEKNMRWAILLDEAINSNNIITYYQALYDVKKEKIIKYEVLVRLRHNEKIYSPFEFLGAARSMQYLPRITLIVFKSACEKFQDNDFMFSINVTDQDLMDKNFIKNIESIRQEYNISSKRIYIEILEEINISSNQLAKDVLLKLSKLQYNLSIDDFGVEGASFSQLNDLNINVVKIDGSFIKNLNSDKNSLYIVESILLYAKRRNIQTVAEFVHNQEIYNIVKELGIDLVQGYFISQPKENL